MKKPIARPLLLVFLALLSVLVYTIFKINDLKEDMQKKERSYEIYKILDSQTVENFIKDNKKEGIYYIGRPSCPDCNMFEPSFLRYIKEHNIQQAITYINVHDYRKSNQNKWEMFKNKYKFSQTPSLIYIKNNEVEDVIEWDEEGLPMNKVINFIKENKKHNHQTSN